METVMKIVLFVIHLTSELLLAILVLAMNYIMMMEILLANLAIIHGFILINKNLKKFNMLRLGEYLVLIL